MENLAFQNTVLFNLYATAPLTHFNLHFTCEHFTLAYYYTSHYGCVNRYPHSMYTSHCINAKDLMVGQEQT